MEQSTLTDCRQRELGAIAQQLVRATRSSQARLIWLSGPKGYGKTTIVRNSAIAARRLGWAVISLSCVSADSASAERFLSEIISRARQLLDRRSELSDPRDPGPQLDIADEMAEELVAGRILEEIAVDRPLLLTIDDTQYFTIEHAKALRYLFSYLGELPMCLLLAGRMDLHRLDDLPLPQLELILTSLAHAEALTLASAEYGDAPHDVLSAIVEQARGSPAEVVALAGFARSSRLSAADVSSSVRTRTRRELLSLPTEVREFLQCCALLEESVDETLSVTLAGCLARLIQLMAEGANNYLVRRGDSLDFSATVLREATRESIELETPIRKKVLDALLSLGRRQDYSRILLHAAALQDFETCFRTAMRAGTDAYSDTRWGASVEAFERALEFGWPSEADYVPFFRQFASALRKLGKQERAAGIVTGALRRANERGYRSGFGCLAASLVSIYTELEDADAAIRTYDLFVGEVVEPEEIAELRAAIGALHANVVDEERYLETTAPLRCATFPQQDSPLAFAVLLHSQTILDARLGRHESAKRALSGLSGKSLAIRSIFDYYLPLTELFVDFQHVGCKALRGMHGDPTGEFREIGNTPYWHYIHLVSDFASGDWRSVDMRLERLNLERFSPIQQALLVAVPVAIGALTRRSSRFEELAAGLIERGRRRRPGASIGQLGLWFILGKTGAPDPALSELATLILSERWDRAHVDAVCMPPVALALYGAKHEPGILKELVPLPTGEHSRWLGAQQLFAHGFARQALGLEGGASSIRLARTEFAAMGADFLAAFAAASLKQSSAADEKMLSQLGVTWFEPQQASRLNGIPTRAETLTAREWQLAHLVAEGMRNRDIAQTLFLSERTVEVHLGNIFGKMNVKSRAQLTRKIVELKALPRPDR